MTLAEQLQAARQRAEIETLNIGDQKAAAEFAKRISLPPVELSPDIRTLLDPFNKWASQRHARRCPAKTTTVALFALEQADMGVAVDVILAQLSAIEAMHDKFSLPNPVRTAAVHHTLETLIKTNPPRSWPKEAKAAFALLPADIRRTIETRERQRDNELQRRLQADKERRQTNGAEQSVHIETEKDTTNDFTQNQGR